MRKDPLEEIVKTEAVYKEEQALRRCKHPNLHFQNAGNRLRCVDCKRYWIAGWKNPQNGMETTITEYGYQNPDILDSEFRHSPNETPRRAPVEQKIR